jgi:nitrate/nitrite transporter NarK
VLCGCGIAVFSVGVPTVSYWYPQRRQGSALALYAGLGNLAPGVFALLAAVSWWWLFGVFHRPMCSGSAAIVILVILLLVFMKDAPYFQYREMGIKIDPDALLLACGQELIPSGTAMQSLRKAAADYRTWILTGLYFISFGGFIALTVWFPTYLGRAFRDEPDRRRGLDSALYSISTSVFRVLGGYASDRWGGEHVTLASFLVLGAGALLMLVFRRRNWQGGRRRADACPGNGVCQCRRFQAGSQVQPRGGRRRRRYCRRPGRLRRLFAIPLMMGAFRQDSARQPDTRRGSACSW